jgi:hypothetical protein
LIGVPDIAFSCTLGCDFSGEIFDVFSVSERTSEPGNSTEISKRPEFLEEVSCLTSI